MHDHVGIGRKYYRIQYCFWHIVYIRRVNSSNTHSSGIKWQIYGYGDGYVLAGYGYACNKLCNRLLHFIKTQSAEPVKYRILTCLRSDGILYLTGCHY